MSDFNIPFSLDPLGTGFGLGDVSAFSIEITAADVIAGTNYHTFFVAAGTGCSVHWGDNAVSVLAAGTNTCTHTYANAGVYLIQVKGPHSRFYHMTGGTASKVIEAVKLYSLATSCLEMFAYCRHPNFKINPGFIVHKNITSISNMFIQVNYLTGGGENWDVQNVVYYNGCFAGTRYNGNIAGWNTRNAKYFTDMFQLDPYFNQNIGMLNVTELLDARFMLQGVTLSISNYDALLIGWASQIVKTGVQFDAGSSKYSSAAASARANLVDNHGWVITDGGLSL